MKWIQKNINLSTQLHNLLKTDAEKRGMSMNAIIRQILHEYYFPKPGVMQSSAVDTKKIEMLLELQEKMVEKSKDLEIIKKRLDILVDQPQHNIQSILDQCMTPKTLFNLSRVLNIEPDELIITLRYLIKQGRLKEKDGTYKTI